MNEWLKERGLSLVLEWVVVPLVLYVIRALRGVIREFEAIVEQGKAHSQDLANTKAELERVKTDVAHLRLNVRDLGRFLQSSGGFKGFRSDSEEDR